MSQKGKRKLLLSSVCKPFGEKAGDGFGSSFEGSHQIMWAQGIFKTRATTTQWGIDFIAANLQTPTVTLHYPSMRQFVSEIKKGYEYVGIAFVVPTFHKMVPMVEAIRKYAPQTKIILGGYGTSMAEELRPYADYICQGEGVSYMRRLLGEPLDQPIVQPEITQQQTLFSLPILGKVGYVFAGLGCPNGCDFCATSHYYKRKHIKLLPDGQSILDAMLRLRQLHPDMVDFWINDEDFLLDEHRGRQFLEAIRKSDLPPVSLSVFGSVKGLSQYKVSELVEMGIDWIWVGFEGKRAGYKKLQGRSFQDLFQDLRAHGISILTSMILGLDYQTPQIIAEEFEELIGLRPSMSQFLIYGPARGTPGWDRLVAEGRLSKDLGRDLSRHDGFYPVFTHPTISSDELLAFHRELYRKEFARLGPTVFRVAEDYLNGYVNLKDHPVKRVREKSIKYRKNAHSILPLFRATKKHVNAHTVAWLEAFQNRLIRETGPMSRLQRFQSRLFPAILRLDKLKELVGYRPQPKFERRTFQPDQELSEVFFPLPSEQARSTSGIDPVEG